MKFRYKKFQEGILRPIIPIEVISQDKSFRYEALVDSGADLCIFHSELANLLGIDLNKGTKFAVFGITGEDSYYYLHPITIKVGGRPIKINAGFMNISHMGHGVVGQKGFFDSFVVKFDLLKEEVELKERSTI